MRRSTKAVSKKKSKVQVQKASQISAASPAKPNVEKKEEPKAPLEVQSELTNPLKKIRDPELDKENPSAAYYTDEGQDDTNLDAPSICEIKGPPSEDQNPDEAQIAAAKTEPQTKPPTKAQ